MRRCFVFGLLLAGCGYSDEDLQAAYRDGHRAGIIWCKRQNELTPPEIDQQLLDEWLRGFQESTAIQCAGPAGRLGL